MSFDDPEVQRLQSRVAELEARIAEQSRTTNALVAESQEKLYWLERWHVDLDDVMRKPAARRALMVANRVRGAVRSVRPGRRGVRRSK